MKKIRTVTINASLPICDVATICKWLSHTAGIRRTSRGQVVKLAIEALAEQIRLTDAAFVINEAQLAHEIVESIAPRNSRAMLTKGERDA